MSTWPLRFIPEQFFWDSMQFPEKKIISLGVQYLFSQKLFLVFLKLKYKTFQS